MSERHPRFVRITHWLTALAFIALLVSGIEVLLSHPRFYWGEVGNVNTAPLFSIPVPSSRGTVPTGYGFVLITGLVYLIAGLRTGHFRRHLVPTKSDRSWRALRKTLTGHLRLTASAFGDPWSYNALQRISYLVVVFVLFPLVIWTGLAMAPAFTAVFPWSVDSLGGRQSARTLHFLVTIALVLFTIVHVTMVILAGFRSRVRAMITGAAETPR